MPTLTYRDALNQALREEMQRDPSVFLMGEEVGVYQGAYKVSRGLLEEFGPMRVVDTPIAELGFAGVGVGGNVVRIGKADVKRAGTDVTLVCHSKTVVPALKAAEQLQEQGVSAEVVDLRSLRPMDEETLVASVAKTNRCVVAEEGWPHCGIGAQVVDIIQREAFDSLDAPVLRVTQADVPMPYNRQLERAAKPSPEKIVAAARRVCYLD